MTRASTGRVWVVLTMAACGLLPASAVRAQERLEVSLLGGLIGGGDLGTTDASMTTNAAPSGSLTPIFVASTSIAAAPTVEGRVAVRLVGGWAIEGGVSYARPDLRVDLSGDVEGAADESATTSLTQVIADVGVRYRWARRRVSPFVIAGGGYLRQLDEPRTTVETGSVVYAGGGVVLRIAPSNRGLLGRLAVRGDARVVWLRDGITLNDARGATFSVAAGLLVRF